MNKTIFVALFSITLAACGGGSSDPINQPVVQAPSEQSNTRQFLINYKGGTGVVEGTDDSRIGAAQKALRAYAPANWGANTEEYRAMLSDSGLKIDMVDIGDGKNYKAIVKMTNQGLSVSVEYVAIPV